MVQSGAIPEELKASSSFNFEPVLARLGGKVDLIRMLVETFEADNQNACADLFSLIENGEIEAATQLAHSIKGSSANLGADNVSALAVDIEARLKAGDTTIDPSIREQFSQAMTALLSEVEQMNSKGQESSAPTSGDSLSDTDFEETLRQLKGVLKTDLGKVKELISFMSEKDLSEAQTATVNTIQEGFKKFKFNVIEEEIDTVLSEH